MPVFDPKRLIEVLNGHGVDYIVIGGVAVGVHGFQRATKDLDIVPNPEVDNLSRLSEALRELDAHIEGVEDVEHEIDLDVEGLGRGGNFVTNTNLGRLDIMQFQGDVDLYQALNKGAIEIRGNDLKLRVCGLKDLIRLKKDIARPQDLIDVEQIDRSNLEESL